MGYFFDVLVDLEVLDEVEWSDDSDALRARRDLLDFDFLDLDFFLRSPLDEADEVDEVDDLLVRWDLVLYLVLLSLEDDEADEVR